MKKRKKKPLSTLEVIEKIVAILVGLTTILPFTAEALKGVLDWIG